MHIVKVQQDQERIDFRRDLRKRERKEARWKDPEVQKIDAARQQIYAEREKGARITGLQLEIDKLRAGLDKADKVRVVQEGQLRTLIGQLGELTGEVAAPEPQPEPEPEPVAEAPRDRGRPSKASR